MGLIIVDFIQELVQVLFNPVIIISTSEQYIAAYYF